MENLDVFIHGLFERKVHLSRRFSLSVVRRSMMESTNGTGLAVQVHVASW